MSISISEPIPRKKEIAVSFLIKNLTEKLNLDIKECTNSSLAEKSFVLESELHRPGMALTGYIELFTHHRIQLLGNTETQYLEHLSKDEQINAINNLTKFDIPAIFLTAGNSLPKYLINLLNKAKIPTYTTPIETTKFMFLVKDFLEDQFALQTMAHGSMVDVYGIGILVIGKSGIGKSEVALDLIERGHRLIADDIVLITKKNNILISASTEISKHFMEVRGLGIIDVLSMFGIRSIRYHKKVDVVLELKLWNEHDNIERTGLGNETIDILGIDVPLIRLPITPGKNITVLAEVIAMNHLLKHHGYDPAETFQTRIKNSIAKKQKAEKEIIKRSIDYFDGGSE